jgi:hypothetical protein
VKQDKIYLGFRTILTPSHFQTGDNDELIRQFGLKSFKKGQLGMPIGLAYDVLGYATCHESLKPCAAGWARPTICSP